MWIRIEGVDLPGAAFGQVGPQRGSEVVDDVAADASTATWTIEVGVVTGQDGAVDLRGPYVHGRRGDRFLYLCWLRDHGGTPVMYRRAKLMLSSVDQALLDRLGAEGSVLVGRIGLTGDDGTPRCAAVRPPTIAWSVEAEDVAPD